MKNWHDDPVTISNDCPCWDSNDALLVAEN
jgi:tRNA-specific 2-thiouridylase